MTQFEYFYFVTGAITALPTLVVSVGYFYRESRNLDDDFLTVLGIFLGMLISAGSVFLWPFYILFALIYGAVKAPKVIEGRKQKKVRDQIETVRAEINQLKESGQLFKQLEMNETVATNRLLITQKERELSELIDKENGFDYRRRAYRGY